MRGINGSAGMRIAEVPKIGDGIGATIRKVNRETVTCVKVICGSKSTGCYGHSVDGYWEISDGVITSSCAITYQNNCICSGGIVGVCRTCRSTCEGITE